MNQFLNIKQWEFLTNSVHNSRVPQAIIFGGQGDRKKETALEFIKLLHQGKIQEQDLVIIQPIEKQIQINQIRELQKALGFKSQFGNYKAIIIEQAHTMNKLAQNCFLKTLEEPQGKTIFILITSFEETLLATIRSRCASLKFFPSGQPKADNPEQIKNLLEKDLLAKFSFAEKIAKTSPEEIKLFLQDLIVVLRQQILNSPTPEVELKERIEKAQQLQFLIQNTNINKRLGLENLMLNL